VAFEAIRQRAIIEGLCKVFAAFACRLDHRRAAFDALRKGGTVLALAPAALLGRLGERSACGSQACSQENRRTSAFCCIMPHIQLQLIPARWVHGGSTIGCSASGCRSRTRLLRRSSSTCV